jgi:hypothetical protein
VSVFRQSMQREPEDKVSIGDIDRRVVRVLPAGGEIETVDVGVLRAAMMCDDLALG